jgi:hypothetical protein
MADAAEEDQIQPSQDAADHGAQDGQQPPGDTAEARPTDEGQAPEQAGDDSDQTSDPLVLAQMEPETRADEPPAKKPATPVAPKPSSPIQKPPAAAIKPSKDDTPKAPADQAKPAAPTQDDPELAEALADLPPEDWGSISHKGKSQYLAQRKLIRSQSEAVRAERKAREEAEGRYQEVDKFVRDQGLGNEEYVNTVAVSGMVKRGDARAIPILEATIQGLRKAAGLPEPQAQAAPARLDDDLAAILREAEEFGIDTSKVRSRFQAPAAQPPPAPAQAAPQQRQQQAPPAARNVAAEDDENDKIVAYLQRRGVADPVARVAELITANPDLAKRQLGERYEAIIEAHSAVVVPQQVRRPTTTQTLSGRGGPGRPAGQTGNADPLKHAIRR